MKRLSVKANFIFSLLNQLVAFISPLIITPYLSRVLGAEAIGQFSFSQSVVQYFIFGATLGITMYAQRCIAEHKNSVEDQSKVFWEIVLLRLIVTSAVLLVYFILSINNVFGSYSLLMNILSINIAACVFDITFFFQGNEHFSTIVVSTILFRVLSLVLSFLLIKTPDDIVIYTWIQVGFTVAINIVLWLFLPKSLKKFSPKGFNPFKHFLPVLRLFIPSLAGLIYTSIDKTLIGVLVKGDTYQYMNNITTLVKLSDVQNGFYEQTYKIVSIGITTMVALGQVMSPRNAAEFATGNYDKVKNNIYKVADFIWCIGIPIVLGIVSITPLFVPMFFGEGFDGVIPLLMTFSLLILLCSLTNLLGNQYLVAIKKDKPFTIFVSIGCVVNVVLSFILIPFIYAFGAVIATLVSELLILILEFIHVRKELNVKHILKRSHKFMIAGLTMVAILLLCNYLLFPYLPIRDLFKLIILIVSGVGIYLLMLLILRERLIFDLIHAIINKFKNLFNKKNSDDSLSKE